MPPGSYGAGGGGGDALKASERQYERDMGKGVKDLEGRQSSTLLAIILPAVNTTKQSCGGLQQGVMVAGGVAGPGGCHRVGLHSRKASRTQYEREAQRGERS